jgi:thioredoxin-like negative regulator of GroEL
MLKMSCKLAPVLWSALVILHPSSLLQAEEIDWRTDYNKARQEAAEKGRPLFLDFGTENCVWCKQLDARTFTDPDLVALLNRRYIPVKIDGSRNPGLTEALHIQNYPTLVYASPDGRILGYQEGFVEAARLKEVLQRALASVMPPEWMVTDYEEAVKAQKEARTARAVSLLKNILDDGKDRPIQSRARAVLQSIEQQAATAYGKGKELADANKNEEATKALTDVTRTYAGTQAARDAEMLLGTLARKMDNGDAQRVRRARELLAQAREDFRRQQFLCCLDRCEMLAVGYSDLPEASEASQLASEIKDNPEWTRQACEQLGDRLSLLYLALAESCLKRGQPQQAVYYFERIVQTFPGSRHAESATVRLSQLQGQPRSGEIKKQ